MTSGGNWQLHDRQSGHGNFPLNLEGCSASLCKLLRLMYITLIPYSYWEAFVQTAVEYCSRYRRLVNSQRGDGEVASFSFSQIKFPES